MGTAAVLKWHTKTVIIWENCFVFKLHCEHSALYIVSMCVALSLPPFAKCGLNSLVEGNSTNWTSELNSSRNIAWILCYRYCNFILLTGDYIAKMGLTASSASLSHKAFILVKILIEYIFWLQNQSLLYKMYF